MGDNDVVESNENRFRKTFCQLPFQSIFEHAEMGKLAVESLVSLLQSKYSADAQAADLLQTAESKYIIHESIDTGPSSLRDTLEELRLYYAAIASNQLRYRVVAEEQCMQPLVSLQEASFKYVQTLQNEITRVHTQYIETQGCYELAHEKWLKAQQDENEAKSKHELALQELGMPGFELQRLANRVEKATKDHKEAHESQNEMKEKLREAIISRDDMARAVSVAYQRAEEERRDQIQSCLSRFTHIESEYLEARKYALQTLKSKVDQIDRSQDIQTFIENHRHAGNLHFEGKTLELLDWQWELQTEKVLSQENKEKISQTAEAIQERNDVEKIQERMNDLCAAHFFDHHTETQTSTALSSLDMAKEDMVESTLEEKSNTPVNAIIETLLQCGTTGEVIEYQKDDEDHIMLEERTEEDASHEEESNIIHPFSIDVFTTLFESMDGRACFLKALNRQRSLNTNIGQSYDNLVIGFHHFLDACVIEDDTKSIKTAMIMSETFYRWKVEEESTTEDARDDRDSKPHRRKEYLQNHVRTHLIWKDPKFWEKALLSAIGEELQKSPLPLPWEQLPTRARRSSSADSDGLTREEAVLRIHNIVFGQLGSFNLSMLEFGVPMIEIHNFIDVMCQVHDLTEEHRSILHKNLTHIAMAKLTE